MRLAFEQWKADYQPKIYEDSGAQCFEHESCHCEFLYTFELSELMEDEENAAALQENRVWSWLQDGSIVSGVTDERAELLITVKPYTEEMEVC